MYCPLNSKWIYRITIDLHNIQNVYFNLNILFSTVSLCVCACEGQKRVLESKPSHLQ